MRTHIQADRHTHTSTNVYTHILYKKQPCINFFYIYTFHWCKANFYSVYVGACVRSYRRVLAPLRQSVRVCVRVKYCGWLSLLSFFSLFTHSVLFFMYIFKKISADAVKKYIVILFIYRKKSVEFWKFKNKI